MKQTKQLLKESYAFTKKVTGIDPSKPTAIREILVSDSNFDTYTKSLMEGMESETDRLGFRILAENTRRTLLENSMFGLNPYESLALPLLRVFFPKTIAKELVTVIPMEKPEIVRGFVKVTFKRFGDALSYMAPANTDITGGPGITVPVNSSVAVGTTDILQIAGVNSDIAHIEKTFMITSVKLDGVDVAVNISPSVDGLISATVDNGAGDQDTLLGRINYLTGVVETSSAGSKISHFAFTATLSLEENTINPRAQFSIEKMRLFAKDRQISSEWTIQLQQDIKALFDVDIQSELVSVMGQQVALDIDREIVNNLIYSCERLNAATHVKTFNKNPASYNGGGSGAQGYAWGPKMWMENVLPKLTDLSNVIYSDTNIGTGNTLACNPMDAGIFESLNSFKYTATNGSEDGDLGYDKATLANGKYKVFTSNIVPQGKILIVYKPVEDSKAVSIFAPYVPAVLTPYPLGNNPTLTILSRYGTQLIRPAGISVLNIIDSPVLTA